ncbi:hypothetical protein Syun_001267 [Stephania yunnanensis]|uniref:Uncharacterized protein n=1 Tax=Stephania yunnanensis TaxID=152371 RepID=A0AAP0LF70_9MAGN
MSVRGPSESYSCLDWSGCLARNRGHNLESQYLVGMRCALSGAPLISLIRHILGTAMPHPMIESAWRFRDSATPTLWHPHSVFVASTRRLTTPAADDGFGVAIGGGFTAATGTVGAPPTFNATEKGKGVVS